MSIAKMVVIVVIWITGCALADYVFTFEDRAWTMLWGYVVGLTALGSAKVTA